MMNNHDISKLSFTLYDEPNDKKLTNSNKYYID